MMVRMGELWTGSWPAAAAVLAALLFFLPVSVRLAIIDIRTHRLPNRLVFPGFAVLVVLLPGAALLAGEAATALRTLAAGAAVGGLYLALRLIHPAGMGLGDVKLAVVLGLLLGFSGWAAVLAGTAGAFLLGGVWGLVLLATGRGTVKTQIPFGPFMIAAAWAALLLVP
ncbi:prepilin peptidase [Arthrobacter sp. 35W]|uniref:prepilin peptidase n=1 Tax=Arthrobacter sp. 35W TaxID=1132441 RepID=UPI000413036B|nr:A24 family peptidase [Arthrobacter sp. 35W]